jgi:protease-4
VHSDGIGTTPLAGKLRLDRPLDPDLGRIFQASTERVYDDFLNMVSSSRNMSVDDVNKVAQGRVWSGEQAKDHDLVDRMGTLQQAIDSAARIAGLGDDYEVNWLEPELTDLEQFLLDMTAATVAKFGPLSAAPRIRPRGFVRKLLDDVLYLASHDRQLTVAAHCLCGVN